MQYKDTSEEILRRDWSNSFADRMLGAMPTGQQKAFVDMMKNRIIVSHHKYGWMNKNYPELCKAVPCLEQRLKCYLKERNIEYLLDVANFALIEYLYPCQEATIYNRDNLEEIKGTSLARVQGYLDMYVETKNKAYLPILAANAMYEFGKPSIKAEFTANDSDKSPGLAGAVSYNELMGIT